MKANNSHFRKPRLETETAVINWHELMTEMMEDYPLVACGRLISRARQLDRELQLGPGHGVLHVTLEAMLGDIAAGDYERILCGWSFRQGERWAEEVLSRLRCEWAVEDAQSRACGCDADFGDDGALSEPEPPPPA